MTDYLEEGPGQGEALLQALEAMVMWIPVPDGRPAEADGGTSLPATDLCIQGSFVSPADRRERDREDHDERGAMIRAMARARAGDVLLWLLLFGAAYLYFFGVPKWVNITLLGLACVKLLLDWMFTVWYRRQY